MIRGRDKGGWRGSLILKTRVIKLMMRLKPLRKVTRGVLMGKKILEAR